MISLPLPKSLTDDALLNSKKITTWIDGYREDDSLYLDSNGRVLNYTNGITTRIVPGKRKLII